jgi:PGF-pre-PGF domain-containing protein
MKKLTILLMSMLIFALASGIGSATDIYVNSTGSIQAAVNNAQPGDKIIVKPGIYTESIRITTQNIAIRSESGNPADTIIRTNSATGFSVRASNTKINGFKVESGETAIYLVGCSDCTITNNDLSDNKIGIYLNISNNNEISGNRANSNTLHGIQLVNSEGNTLLNNSVNSNTRGVNSITSNKNKILDNIALNNSQYGMWISQSNDNNISGNTVSGCGNDRAGSGGIHFNSSSRNVIFGNIVAFNDGYAFFECPACHNNRVYNNYVNNDRNANINARDTTWDVAKISGRNIVGGPYIGGNFWANPEGTGFSQKATDEDRDGIADSSYSDNSGNIVDNHPLVLVSNPILPIVDFSANVTSGYAPFSVQFMDQSQNAISWRWDFENDGDIDSLDRNPVHTYTIPENYTAKLTVSNVNGTASKTVQIMAGNFKIYPVADFSANATSGYAPFSVQFTDLSQNATSRIWDFNNDGQPDSNESSPVYVYTAPGTYNVSLTAINVNGTASKTVQIIAEESKVYPVADFSASVTSGYAPLSVQFADLSQNATSRIWDFNNDGQFDSNESSPVYVYTAPGTYNVNLTAINVNGTSSKTTLITVIEKRDHSPGSGGSGGGGGGSPEPAKNVEVKELSQAFITNGKPAKFDFAKNATCVVYVNFDSKKTAGKMTTIAEQLKGKSTLVSDLNAGEIYKYFNIWVGTGGFATSKNIENPVVCFKVEKSWLQDKKVDKASITLNRYSDKKWSQLPVKMLNEDNKYMYFTAETPEFSFFAITGKAVEKETVTETKPVTDVQDLGQNSSTASETEQGQKPEQETGKDKVTSIPGFEAAYVIACLLMVIRHKRK